MDWLKEAGWVIKALRPPPKPIVGPFSAIIVLHPPDKRKVDIDNRIKVLLDLAQKMELIENDHFCRLLVVSYGDSESAPLGAKLILQPF